MRLWSVISDIQGTSKLSLALSQLRNPSQSQSKAKGLVSPIFVILYYYALSLSLALKLAVYSARAQTSAKTLV